MTEVNPDQDGSANGTSGDGGDAPTLTKTQGEKLVSDALAKAGRDATTLGDARTQLDADLATHESNVLIFNTRMDEAEDAAHKDNPEALTALRNSRELNRLKVDVERREKEATVREKTLTEREETAGVATRNAMAADIAKELSVNLPLLLDHGGTTEESMRKLAGALPKVSTNTTDDPVPDSGAGTGGEAVTKDNIDKLHMDGKVTDDVYRQFLRTGQLTPVGV